jgi:hypothetical protein
MKEDGGVVKENGNEKEGRLLALKRRKEKERAKE